MSQILRDITEITRCSVQYRADSLEPLGLKACHSSYLAEICAQPGITQDGLAGRICVNKSSVARQLAVLEEEGFVRRVTNAQDRRAVNLYPTEKALALLPQLTALHDTWQAYLTQDLSGEEAVLLEQLLRRLRSRAAGWMEAREE